jgi:predicted dehydrogenase
VVEVNLDIHFQPNPVVRSLHRIGIVGAGEIVTSAHLPAYQQAGFYVTGITSLPLELAEVVAKKFAIPKIYPDLDSLLLDPEVEVVDIAVPAFAQPEIAIRAIRRGKHILCQKPLAPSFTAAKEIVREANQYGVKLAVNQNGRWTPGFSASKDLIRRGLLGIPTFAKVESSRWGIGYSSWLATVRQDIVLYSALHFLDAIRFLFGMPERVSAVSSRYPGQKEIGETFAFIVMEFSQGLVACVLDSQQNWTGEPILNYRFEGTEGMVEGTIGIHKDYPLGEPDTIKFRSKAYGDVWFSPKLNGKWIPDAFIGTMGELLESIEQDRQPSNSGEDNLESLKLVFAAYQSMEEKRSVNPQEIN